MHNNWAINGEIVTIKHVFWGDVQPVFFVVENNVKELFVCSLYDDRCGLNWIVCPTTLELLSKMIHNLITIRELFDLSQKIGLSYNVGLKNGKYEVEKILYRQICCDDLPSAGYYFNGDIEDIIDFMKDFSLDEGCTDNRYTKKSFSSNKKSAFKKYLVENHRSWLNYRGRVNKQKRGLLV